MSTVHSARTPDELMALALDAAACGTRSVRPNPKVGTAIELTNGEVITGFHAICGGPHAERVALAHCEARGLRTRGARVAVTLEPCAHTGKTPPCVDALISAEVAQVIIPFADPNPLVAGRGIAKLKAAGIDVLQGVGTSAAFAINRGWLWAQALQRPFVSLKMATSANHVWKNPSTRWITSPGARTHAMALRAMVDVVITSGQTVRDDDPAFTARGPGGEILGDQPRVIILSQRRDWHAHGQLAQHPRGFRTDTWSALADGLGKLFLTEQVAHAMVEAGPRLCAAFLVAGCVDEVWRYASGEQLGGTAADLTPELLANFTCVQKEILDSENTFELWLRKDRFEKNYFARF